MPAFGAGPVGCVSIIDTVAWPAGRPRLAVGAGITPIALCPLSLVLVPELRLCARPGWLASRVFAHPCLPTGQRGLNELARPTDIAHPLVVWRTAVFALLALRRETDDKTGRDEALIWATGFAAPALAWPPGGV